MSHIHSLEITSATPTIRVVLSHDGPLTKDLINLAGSHVYARGEHWDLADWSLSARGIRKTSPSALTLTREPVGPGFIPSRLETVALQLSIKGIEQPLIAAAVVDGTGDALVANALDAAGAQLAGKLDTIATSAAQGATTADIKGLETATQQELTSLNATSAEGFAGMSGRMGSVGDDVQTGMRWLTEFPIEVSSGSGATPAAVPSGGATLVDQQMRAVLGRSITPSGQPIGSAGVASMLAALDRSFQPVDDDGAITYAYSPASYDQQTAIGAGVTGQQASLARLAQNATDEIMGLVSGLEPLVPESQVNPDEIGAATAIFQQSWTAFVAELAADGGPRLPRAEGLLHDAQRELGRLLFLLGMFLPADGKSFTVGAVRRQYVVTLDDETNLTNGIIVNDRVSVVATAFATYRDSLLGLDRVAPNDDRGMEIVRLQRDLDAVAELAHAVYDALDSVDIGLDRREITVISSEQGLMLEDVVSWAANFPADEAQPLLLDGGTLGALAIQRRAEQLQHAVKRAIKFSESGDAEAGLKHPRVQVQLRRLETVLELVVKGAANLAKKGHVNDVVVPGARATNGKAPVPAGGEEPAATPTVVGRGDGPANPDTTGS